jgi:hypothetical protein
MLERWERWTVECVFSLLSSFLPWYKLTTNREQFFAYCFEALIPKEMDLFILELDINNRACALSLFFLLSSEEADSNMNSALDQLRDDDTLMRALLQLPQEPAVGASAFSQVERKTKLIFLSFPSSCLRLRPPLR